MGRILFIHNNNSKGSPSSSSASLPPSLSFFLFRFIVLFTIATVTVSPSSDVDSSEYHHRYIIIGAGPGGLQMAHYLQSIFRDYIVLEQNIQVGSFFIQYPRWRQLISINKHETGREELDFNYRHDWNSLLPEPSHSYQQPRFDDNTSIPSSSSSATSYDSIPMVNYSSTDPQYTVSFLNSTLLFRSFTSTYYPEADNLVDYLQNWATLPPPSSSLSTSSSPSNPSVSKTTRIQGLGRTQPLRIRYRTRIIRIEQISTQSPSPENPHLSRFRLYTSTNETYTCTYLLLGTGLQEMVYPLGNNTMQAINDGLLTTYANASTNLDDYRNQSVLILGRGNAAFEFANNILEVTSYVHLLGRSSGRIRLAWETHYPGDVRSVHNHLLETYLLKSMDGMAEIPMEHLVFQKGEERIRNHTLKNGTVLPQPYHRIAVSDQFTPCVYDDYGRAINRCFFRREYDYVIICPGWKFSNTIFSSLPSSSPKDKDNDKRVPDYHTNQKHPSITAKYESTNIPGLYFVGNLMHAHDAKKSSGGFIHGFRYLVRALHRILEEEEQQLLIRIRSVTNRTTPTEQETMVTMKSATDPSTVTVPSVPNSFIQGLVPQGWPRRSIHGLRSIVANILRRINYASGPYQMFGGLADVFIFSPIEQSSASLSTLVSSYSSRYYQGVGTLAGMYHPLSFFEHAAELYRNDSSNERSIYADILQHQLSLASTRSQSLLNDPLYIKQEESNQIINTALIGTLYEEVPVKLVHEKVRLWYQQQCIQTTKNARYSVPFICNQDTDRKKENHHHIEYITITLEFGSKGSSVPIPMDPNIMNTMKGEDYIKAKGEASRDPFSRLRANVGLHNPEDSHFLHPVIHYYHTGIASMTKENTDGNNNVHKSTQSGKNNSSSTTTNDISSSSSVVTLQPTATLHIIEDFYTDWTHFTAHILPLARFLQHIGHNRIRTFHANLQMYHQWLQSLSPSSVLPLPAPSTVPLTYRQNYTAYVRNVWNISRVPSTHYSLVDRLMSSSNATLYYKGYKIKGCEGWQHQLSIQSIDELVYSPSSSVIVTHFIDPYPTLPLTFEEHQYTLAIYHESIKLRDGLGLLYPKTVYPYTLPPNILHPRIQQQSEQYLNFLDSYYKNITLSLPGLPVILYHVRNGDSRLKFEEFIPRKPNINHTGTETTNTRGNKLPWVRIFNSNRISLNNQKGNVIDLDGTDFGTLPIKYEELWKKYFLTNN